MASSTRMILDCSSLPLTDFFIGFQFANGSDDGSISGCFSMLYDACRQQQIEIHLHHSQYPESMSSILVNMIVYLLGIIGFATAFYAAEVLVPRVTVVRYLVLSDINKRFIPSTIHSMNRYRLQRCHQTGVGIRMYEMSKK